MKVLLRILLFSYEYTSQGKKVHSFHLGSLIHTCCPPLLATLSIYKEIFHTKGHWWLIFGLWRIPKFHNRRGKVIWRHSSKQNKQKIDEDNRCRCYPVFIKYEHRFVVTSTFYKVYFTCSHHGKIHNKLQHHNKNVFYNFFYFQTVHKEH